jgi:hypothetical protein
VENTRFLPQLKTPIHLTKKTDWHWKAVSFRGRNLDRRDVIGPQALNLSLVPDLYRDPVRCRVTRPRRDVAQVLDAGDRPMTLQVVGSAFRHRSHSARFGKTSTTHKSDDCLSPQRESIGRSRVAVILRTVANPRIPS